ncbi:hypothetical protein [Rhizobium laguerreae]|uniref:hypothetical protein n=1 Tax=Rhizobium laguerreae TaxID=1076926 RepID=UPI001C8FC953|nr:hypothetical protein [Rhizobium laguerreae]MBY3238432.1 hypothetical protein [Rhizobium laguerreae]MBY3378114.1 hypothetical protein [Rhizobium laguerreae]
MDHVFAVAVRAMKDAQDEMQQVVPQPRFVTSEVGHRGHRFVEQLPQQALLLKAVRILSAIHTLKLTIDAGLLLDAGASMRILDEIGSEVQFLAAPYLTNAGREAIHDEFLTEFFQEEFDHSDVLKSSQKRHRVSRKKIRAYVVRAYRQEDASTHTDVLRLIDNTFSGFVHGAAAHIMDTYDGKRFSVPAPGDHASLLDFRDQFSIYLHRALMDFAFAAKALGCEAIFARLYQFITTTFADEGSVR